LIALGPHLVLLACLMVAFGSLLMLYWVQLLGKKPFILNALQNDTFF
jgi:hypothetical protein